MRGFLMIMPFILMTGLIGWIGQCIQNHDYSSLLIAVIVSVVTIVAYNIIRKFVIAKL